MKTALTIAVAILSLTAFQTQAAQTYVGATRSTMRITMTPSSSSGVSREQVLAELAAAKRSGDILATGQSGLKLNEMYPGQYPTAPVLASKTREQVNAELTAAVRNGDMMAGGQIGLKLNEMYPSQYPAAQVLAGKTREQVKAELTVALRTGDYMIGGEVGGKCNEVHPNMHKAS